MDLNNFKTDENLLENGVWVKLGEDSDLLIASQDSARYRQALRKAMAPYKGFRDKTLLPDDVQKRILVGSLAAVLLDWKGLKENGKAIKYSPDEAVRVLTEYTTIRNIVAEVSGSDAAFLPDLEDAAKNSGNASAGN